jgi:hypothetical protein
MAATATLTGGRDPALSENGEPVLPILASLALVPAAIQAGTVTTTAYCQSGRTASGAWTQPGIAAANFLRLGTRIRIWPAALGRTTFVILDRIGWGSSLDLWTGSCAAAIQYGRRLEHVTILR